MKTTSPLSFRAYAVKELACMYFPDKSVERACRLFRSTIQEDPLLLKQLEEHGFRPRKRILVPRAVQAIVQYLGSPQEFYAIVHEA